MRAWCLVTIGLGGFVFGSVMRPITFALPEQQMEIREDPWYNR